jgi:RNA polymerase sigma-70 factor (ECF subfamily)
VEGLHPAESELVERARRGQADAYAELVRLHRDAAFRTAYLITGSAADAEESAQDGFVKAYRALGSFRAGAPFRPWLLRIVANDARNRRRARGRREAFSLRLVSDAEVTGDEPVRTDERADLLRALAVLRREEQLAIVAKYLIGLTDEECAAALDAPLGTVKSWVARGLAHLRRELEEGAA